jgi:hypothetical protein
VCNCRAYKFPHRFLGGACNGAAWIAEIHDPWSVCKGCNFLADDGITCQVLEGLEPINKCPELQDYIRYEGIQLYGVNRVHRPSRVSGALGR